MVYRSINSGEKESDYHRIIFPEFQYYSLRVERRGLYTLIWTVDNEPRGIESIAFLTSNGKHYTYFKLFGVKDAFPACYLFETLEDAYNEAELRNGSIRGTVAMLEPDQYLVTPSPVK